MKEETERTLKATGASSSTNEVPSLDVEKIGVAIAQATSPKAKEDIQHMVEAKLGDTKSDISHITPDMIASIPSMPERDSQRNMWILTIGMFFMSIGYTMVVPFLPVYLLELGVTTDDVALWSGLVFSVAFLIAGVMAPIWGKMSDKKGRKLMVIRAGFALAITYIMGGFVQTGWQLLVVRALQGFANGFLPAAMTLITTSVPKHKVGYALGIFQTGMIAGQVIGPLSGGVLSSVFGMRPAFFIVGITMTFVSLAVVKWVKEPAKAVATQPLETEEKKANEGSIFQDLQAAWHNKKLVELLILFFMVQGSILMLQPIVTLYIGEMLGSMKDAGMVAGLIISLGGTLGAIMTPRWGKFGQRRGYYFTIFLGHVSGGILTFTQGLIPNVWVFGILQMGIGILAYGVMPSLSAAVALCTTSENRGRAFGLVTTSQQFGSMAGPLLASLVSMYIGYAQVFLIAGLIMMTTSSVVWRRHHKKFGQATVAS